MGLEPGLLSVKDGVDCGLLVGTGISSPGSTHSIEVTGIGVTGAGVGVGGGGGGGGFCSWVTERGVG